MIHALLILLVLSFPALVILGGARDAASYVIPNWISLALIAAFVVAAPLAGLPAAAIGLHMGVGASALVAGMAMFALGWIGGGDAKLFAASALWLGWSAAPSFLAATGLAGGLLAVSLLALRSPRLASVAQTGPAWVGRLAQPGGAVPYGVAIAVGALAAFPASPFAALL